MDTIEQIIFSKYNQSALPCIDADTLPHSGTGYFYPIDHTSSIVYFVDKYHRCGYIVQIKITNIQTGVNNNSSFVLHQRHTDSKNLIAYSGPNELYDDCIIREHNEHIFYDQLKNIIEGNTVIIGNYTFAIIEA